MEPILEKPTPENVKHFHADIRRKQDTDNGLIIEGWASTKDLDRQDEVVEPVAFTSGLSSFMQNPILLYMHNWTQPIGKIVEAKIDDVEGFWIRAIISKADDVRDIATKIKEGILRAFSIGFSVPDEGIETLDGIRHIKTLELYEVSIVTIPANREALFSVAKAMQYGSDLVVPYDQLVREVDELKLKLAAPASVEVVHPKPAEDTPLEAVEERYKAFLAELENVRESIVAEKLGACARTFDDEMNRMRKAGAQLWSPKS